MTTENAKRKRNKSSHPLQQNDQLGHPDKETHSARVFCFVLLLLLLFCVCVCARECVLVLFLFVVVLLAGTWMVQQAADKIFSTVFWW